jgi:hypothetical protein
LVLFSQPLEGIKKFQIGGLQSCLYLSSGEAVTNASTNERAFGTPRASSIHAVHGGLPGPAATTALKAVSTEGACVVPYQTNVPALERGQHLGYVGALTCAERATCTSVEYPTGSCFPHVPFGTLKLTSRNEVGIWPDYIEASTLESLFNFAIGKLESLFESRLSAIRTASSIKDMHSLCGPFVVTRKTLKFVAVRHALVRLKQLNLLRLQLTFRILLREQTA